jgi:hypothetical protein
VKAGAAGNYGYQLDCQTASGPLAATVPVAVQ